MIPTQWLQLPNGDLDLSKGLQLTTTLAQYVTQKLRQRLRFFLGEWFIDTRLGVPYFQRVFVENPDLALLATLYRDIVIGTTGVASVRDLVLDFDKKTRTLFVSFVAVLQDGDLVVFKKEPFVLGLAA